MGEGGVVDDPQVEKGGLSYDPQVAEEEVVDDPQVVEDKLAYEIVSSSFETTEWESLMEFL